jgi:hypothetical protein
MVLLKDGRCHWRSVVEHCVLAKRTDTARDDVPFCAESRQSFVPQAAQKLMVTRFPLPSEACLKVAGLPATPNPRRSAFPRLNSA